LFSVLLCVSFKTFPSVLNIWCLSNAFIYSPFIVIYNISMVSCIEPCICLFSKIYWSFYWCLIFLGLVALTRLLYLVLNVHSVWLRCFLLQFLHVSWYVPLFWCGFIYWRCFHLSYVFFL
jgi:hypothetical protein